LGEKNLYLSGFRDYLWENCTQHSWNPLQLVVDILH